MRKKELINPAIVEDDRTGMSVAALKRAFADNLYYVQGVNETLATQHDYYMALSYTIRDRLMHRWIKTQETYLKENAKSVSYLSAEFLMGRQLGKNLLNTDCWMKARQVLEESGLKFYDIVRQELEPGLGNGGLGRLAACFLDSLATLEIPAFGYGIRYEFGIFRQAFENGWQVEHPDEWLLLGNPWEVHRPHHTIEVGFGGHTENRRDQNGKAKSVWNPAHTVLGTPYDTLVPGFNTETVNTLRLWSARASKSFDFQVFDSGDYARAVEEKTFSENISKVLYPNDNLPQGRELRLKQQYFFVACSIQDIIRRYLFNHTDLSQLHKSAAIQLNDTHPAIGVAELMRLLLDIHDLDWDTAWEVTQGCIGFTNHTLLSEALERWPVELFENLLPRHLEIIYEINARFLSEVKYRFPDDEDKVGRLSIIEEGEPKQIRMAHLATVGCHSVNGVAKLHSDLVKKELLNEFYELWPEKFNNKTNGVTPRRWMMLSNQKLTFLITEKIGKGWLKDLDQLKKLEKFVDDPTFLDTWAMFKEDNKRELAEYILEKVGVSVDPSSMFDIQVKRIHEYKRQLLSALHIITLYNRIKSGQDTDMVPRTFIFGGKAAPGYHMAKLIIKLINSIAEVVNNDPQVRDILKVVFLPNYCVSAGERVYPAADLSEQISTAGKEASGTGNMKFSLNGALTIGTLDGANIEIRDAVGEENFFLFGSTVEQIREMQYHGYNPREYYDRDGELRAAIDSIACGRFSRGDGGAFGEIVDHLLNEDSYFLCADYRAYIDCQKEVDEVYRDRTKWTKMAVLNVARMGYFSSDRTIKEYCDEIWGVKPVKVNLEDYDPDNAHIHASETPSYLEKPKKK